MMRAIGPLSSGVAVGGAGVATANATSLFPVQGKLAGLYIRYNDSPPAGTTDVTIKTAGEFTPSYNLLVLTNAATDGLFIPTVAQVDPAGAARTAYSPAPVHDKINIKIDQANAGDSVDIWFFFED
jgi:hypothetical protein